MSPDSKAPLQPSPSTESPLSGLVTFLKVLRKHWAVVVACALLSCGAALLYTKSVRKVYEASSLIEMSPRAPQPLGDSSAQSPGFDMSLLFIDPQEYYLTQYNIITSRAVLQAAAEAISLGSDYEFFGLSQPPDQPISPAQAAAALASRVTVEPVKGAVSRTSG